jgi:tetratricopeptide (TPR) repeat protein
MRSLVPLLMVLSCVTVIYTQEVTVTATTNQREIQRILSREREASRINQAYFSEDRVCRGFLAAKEWRKAEASCRKAIQLVEKLPKEHVLERSGSRASLAIALLWQKRPQEALPLLNKSLEIRKTEASDSDADTGDLYFLLGQTHRMLNDVLMARSLYERAESSYRAAFVEIDDEWLRASYARRLKNAVEAHYDLVESEGLFEDAENLKGRLNKLRSDFAKYLEADDER